MSEIFGFRTARQIDCPVPLHRYILNILVPHNASAVIAKKRLYPCPPPHPWHEMRPEGSRRMQTRWRRRRCVALLTNCMVVTLSHMALGFAWFAPNGGRYARLLNDMQRGLVGVAANRVLSMRRFLKGSEGGAASLERLASAGDKLWDCMDALQFVPYACVRSRTPWSADTMGSGTLPSTRPGPLVAARIDLPDSLSEFEPRPSCVRKAIWVDEAGGAAEAGQRVGSWIA